MIINSIIKLIFSTIEFSAAIVLTFSIFRIPFKYEFPKIFIVSLFISFIFLFQNDIVNLQQFAFITQILCYVIFFIFIFNLPIFYAVIVSMTAYIAFAILQIFLVLILGLFGINHNIIQSSILNVASFQVFETFIAALIILWMQYKKIGFMFVANRIQLIHSIKGYNMFLSGTIILSIILIQLYIFSLSHNIRIFYILATLTVIFILGLLFTYLKNKKELREKYAHFNMKRR